jgi:large subunit ribosomal protein L4
MDAKIYNKDGKEAGSVKLSDTVFGLNWNADLVHQVAVSMMSNNRQGSAHSKDRSEVSGGGKKPWQQKGTGRARHGSRRSPIWRTGGVTHGPSNERNYDKKINKKMKAKALYTVLSAKLRGGEILFVDSLTPSAVKTKDAQVALVNLAKVEGFDRLAGSPKRVAHIAFAAHSDEAVKSYRNIPYVDTDEFRNLNVLDVLNHQYLVIENPAETLKNLEAKMQ